MYRIIITIAIAALLGAGCTIKQNEDTTTEVQSSDDVWTLQGTDFESVSEEVAVWATKTFSEDAGGNPFGVVRSEASKFTGELELIASYQVRVVDIPDGRRVGEYPEPTEPKAFFIFVLKDEQGRAFRTFVQSSDDETFKATAFGPALDRQTVVDATKSKRHLNTWPAMELQNEAEKMDAELVLIPYPYPMNQVYYQYGTEVETSQLVNAETGASYTNLTDLLDSIESDWASFK